MGKNEIGNEKKEEIKENINIIGIKEEINNYANFLSINRFRNKPNSIVNLMMINGFRKKITYEINLS